MKICKLVTILLVAFSTVLNAQQISTELVNLNADGTLTYKADALGNTLIDHGMVGYQQGLKPFPAVPTVLTLHQTSGDRTRDIQHAIDRIEEMPLHNGYRGALLLKAGYYELKGTLTIEASGVVLRGEGSGPGGTLLHHTAKEKVNVLTIKGKSSTALYDAVKKITSSYVPIGAKSVVVEDGHNFRLGDKVVVTRKPNQQWVDKLGMNDILSVCGEGHKDWKPGKFKTKSKHNIIAVSGNKLTFDTPLTDQIGAPYSQGQVQKYSWTGIEECGVENIKFESKAVSEFDENHANSAIFVNNLRNGWFRNIKAKDFMNNLIKVKSCYQITVDKCEIEDYKSKDEGGRRYGFGINESQLILFKNCTSNNGRHCFVLGSKAIGPNVYFNCTSTNARADNGPHQKWSTGILWENITTNNELNLKLRKCSGSGHGWTSAQNTLWNCKAKEIIVQEPIKDYHQNWAIGCTGEITNDTKFYGALGHVELKDRPVGFSLYEYQARNYKKSLLADNCGYKHVRGAALDIGSGGGKTFIVGTNRMVYEWKENNWVETNSPQANRIDVAGDGTPYIIAKDGKIHRLVNNNWELIQGWATDIGCAGTKVYVIGGGNLIYRWNGGSSWSRLPGKATRIDVFGDGNPWIVGTDNSVYQFKNNTWLRKGNFSARDIGIQDGGFEVYALAESNGAVFGLYGVNTWKGVSGGANNISVNHNGNVWVVNSRNTIFVKTCAKTYLREASENNMEASRLEGFDLYPNPATNLMWIDLSNFADKAVHYSIMNVLGQVVDSNHFEKNHAPNEQISLTDFKNGTYIIALEAAGNQRLSKQFIVLNR